MIIRTADLMDEHPTLEVGLPLFQNYGLRSSFFGQIRTVKCFEDNSMVRQALEGKGNNQVLVIDGGASLNCALVGDRLVELAIKNEWQGIIVNGCIRDSEAINQMNFAIKALATNPKKSLKANQGEIDLELHFANLNFIPHQYVYADRDGIVVSARKLID